ncbi:MAG: DUF4258 domain-containing protein [Candidatus Micrarchaeota archaeon]
MNSKNIKFTVICKLGKQIKTTYSHWEKIITVKHPIVKDKEKEVEKTLTDPIEIRVSKTDNQVYLYYCDFEGNFFAVVSKHLNDDGYIITCYITDWIKEGRIIWKK